MNTYETINDVLVHLFNEIWELEEKAIITEEYKDITNNDMHIIEAIGLGEGKTMSAIGEDKLTLPAKLHILKSGEESEITLTIREGKFHQVKRMFHAVGKEVVYLKRLRMGSLVLDENLKTGEYRALTDEERRTLTGENE